MEEQELRHALRGAMAAAAQPPSMNATTALDAARRAHRRRRATLAGVGSAAAVIVIAAGAMIVAATTGGGHQTPAGGDGAAPVLTQPSPPPPRETSETQWPDGQTDRTARQGPQYEKGVRLLELLTASLPAGLEAPADLQPADPSERSGPLRYHQAQFADEVGGKQIWEYLAQMPVGANGKWGQLLVKVHTPGAFATGEGCELTMTFWGMGGRCEPVDVNGTKVGVVVAPTGDDRLDQGGAGYRHPDGTVVFVAQARSYSMTGLAALAEPPLSVRQLAELAVDPKFRIG